MVSKSGFSKIFVPAIFLLLSLPSSVFARYSGPMRFSVFLPCNGGISFGAPRILAEGRIEADSAKKFARFLAEKNRHAYRLPSKPTVCFDSQGGELLGAIDIGNTIRVNGFSTCLESNYCRVKAGSSSHENEIFLEDAVCASACVFALAGGVKREIGENAMVGIHQFSGPHWDRRDDTTPLSIDAVSGYLELMGIKGRLLSMASRYPPDRIHWLSASEISQIGLRNDYRQVHNKR
jgi:hypothetical protein